MTVPSEKMLRTLAAWYGVPVTDDKEALDKSIKKAAAARRQRRRDTPMTDRDYVMVMEILSRRYSVTSAEFARATKMSRGRAQEFLRRLECEGVLTSMHRMNRQLHYTLRTP